MHWPHGVEGTGNVLRDLESKVNSRSNSKVNHVFSFNASPPKPLDNTENVSCDSQIMYFLVNASPPKLLDVATSTLLVHRSHMSLLSNSAYSKAFNVGICHLQT